MPTVSSMLKMLNDSKQENLTLLDRTLGPVGEKYAYFGSRFYGQEAVFYVFKVRGA